MSTNARQGIVWRHPRLNQADLIELLRNGIPDGQRAWYLVARIDGTDFFDFDKASADKMVEDWTQGRVFCEACEIRWRRSPDSRANDVLFLCEDSALMQEGFQLIGESWQALEPGENASLVAWGSPPDPRSPNIRAESRLPKRLRYPATCKEGRVRCLYYRAESGEVQFIRLTEVR